MATIKKSTKAGYVTLGYGQVEPNHLSAQRTAQIYAQLPAAADIDVLEQGQFVKYDYLNGVVNYTGAGEWMLVYNETKIYRDHESDCDFALVKKDYNARVYSPIGGVTGYANARNYEGVVNSAEYRADATENPFVLEQRDRLTMMPEGTKMVPRVFKTNVGDIFTTNTIVDTELALGDILAPNAEGYLAKTEAADGMQWQVVKLTTMPDRQKAVKIMRIA